MPSQTAAERGEAELRILDFKTTWSKFKKLSQTAARRGKAELHILDFKTTWSEFQKPSQTLAEQGQHLTVKTSAKSLPITSFEQYKSWSSRLTFFWTHYLLKTSLVSFQKFTSDTMEHETKHFLGPLSCRLTLADLFLDFFLLKVSLMIFQRKLLLIG